MEEGLHELERGLLVVLVTHREHGGACRGEIGQQRGRRGREQAGAGEVDRRLERFGRHVVVGVAVRQRERAQARRMARGEDLRDGTAGVVRDQVDAVEVERVAELLDHIGERRQREVLVGVRRTPTVQRKVERNAAAFVRDERDDVAPQVRARPDAVDEESDVTLAHVDVAEVGARGVDERAVGVEAVEVHLAS